MIPMLEAAFVLHRRPFSDSSLLLEVFSRTSGRQPLIARGARNAKRRVARLQPFVPLWVRRSGRGEVGSLAQAEPRGPAIDLTGPRLYCGMYVNELIARLVPRDEAIEELFLHYEDALTALASDRDIEPVLRGFELQMLEQLGYAPLLTHTGDDDAPLHPDAWYDYHPSQGPRKAAPRSLEAVRGATLLAMARRDFSDPVVRKESLRLMRGIIDHYLEHKPLKSRELFTRVS